MVVLQGGVNWSEVLPDNAMQALTSLFDNPLWEATQQQLVNPALSVHCC